MCIRDSAPSGRPAVGFRTPGSPRSGFLRLLYQLSLIHICHRTDPAHRLLILRDRARRASGREAAAEVRCGTELSSGKRRLHHTRFRRTALRPHLLRRDHPVDPGRDRVREDLLSAPARRDAGYDADARRLPNAERGAVSGLSLIHI